MADFLRQLLIVLAILMCLHQGTSSMEIDIKILEHNGAIPKALKITCTPEQTDNCARKVLALQLAQNNRTLATLQQNSKIFFDRVLQSDIQAEGHIDTDVTKSSLTVTFGNILMEDSGVYTCTMVYFDRQGHLHEDEASKNFTVESNNMYDVVRSLMGEMSSMQKTLTETTTTLQNQLNETMTTLQNQHAEEISSINERTTTLQRQLAEQETELKELRNRTDEYIANDNVTSAFMAGHSAEDRARKNQVMEFSDVKLNIGGNYNVGNNTYTAPVDGIYAFNLFLRVRSASEYIDVSVRVNNVKSAKLYAFDRGSGDASSVSPIVQLKAGDTVNCFVDTWSYYVQVTAFPYTTFSGHLLKAL